MKTIGRRETVVIGIVAMIAVIAAGWFLLIKPASSKVSGLKKQADQQQQDNQALQTEIAVLQSGKKKLKQEQAELLSLTQRVPSSVELPTLLRQMQQAAKDSGVTLKGITPTQPAPLPGAQGIEAVGITLNVGGGYAEIEQMDSALESLSRAFLVSGFSLTSGSGGTTTGSSTAAASTSSGSADEIAATFNGRILLRTPTGAKSAAG